MSVGDDAIIGPQRGAPRALLIAARSSGYEPVARILAARGYDVRISDDPDAVEVDDRMSVPVVVVEHAPPDRDATTICAVWRTRPGGAAAAILAIVPAGSVADPRELVAAGATDVLVAPHDVAMLETRLSLIERQATLRRALVDATARADREAQNARLLASAAARQVQERDLLDRVRTALARELDLPALYVTVVEAIAAAFGYSQVSLYRLRRGTLVLQHQVGYPQVLDKIPVERGVMGRVARTGEAALIPDVSTEASFLGAFEGITSEVCVPFHDRGRVAGVINVETIEGVRLGDPDLRLMTALSEHVSIGMDRARLHDRVRSSEQRLHLALDAAGIGTWDWHIPSGQVAWSLQVGPLYGLPLGTPGLATEDWFNLIHPEDRERVRAADRVHLEHGTDYEVEFRVIRPDGELCWLVGWGRAVERSETGGAIRSVGLTMDISARKRSEEARVALEREHAMRGVAEAAQRRSAFLAEAGTTLSGSLDPVATLEAIARLVVPRLADWCLVDLIPDAESGDEPEVVVAHADPQIEAWLRQARREHPIDAAANDGPGHVLRTGVGRLYPSPAGSLSTVIGGEEDGEFASGPAVGSLLAVPLTARGATLGVLTLGTNRQDGYGASDLQLAEELARRAALAADNARLYRSAQNAIRDRDQFLSVAAHELRTPVTTIGGFAELLERENRGGRLGERATRFLSRIGEASERLTGLIEDLLDVSRIRLGVMPLRLQSVDLGVLVEAVTERYRDEIGPRYRLEVLIAGDCAVAADADRIEQVLTNLLTNAVKYSPEGGPIAVSVGPDEAGVRVSVADRGIGLAAENLESIFVAFGRAPNAERSAVQGLGLGLSICRSVVERHGGRIWAESAGELLGTTLHVWLPSERNPAPPPH